MNVDELLITDNIIFHPIIIIESRKLKMNEKNTSKKQKSNITANRNWIGKETKNALMSLVDTSAFLGVSKRTVRRLVDQRDLSFFKVGRQLRFLLQDLNNYLTAHRVEKL